jgi:hypothetical protein
MSSFSLRNAVLVGIAGCLLLLILAHYFLKSHAPYGVVPGNTSRQQDLSSPAAQPPAESFAQRRPAECIDPVVSLDSISGWWIRKYTDGDRAAKLGRFVDTVYPTALRIGENRITAYMHSPKDPEQRLNLFLVGKVLKVDDEAVTVKWAMNPGRGLPWVVNQWSIDQKRYQLVEPAEDAIGPKFDGIQHDLAMYVNAQADEMWIKTRRGEIVGDFIGDSSVYVKVGHPVFEGTK